MPEEARLIGAFAVALAGAFAATPLAIAVAARTDFHDRPLGYKRHRQPTPYLGGAAVLGGFLVGALTIGEEISRLAPIVLGTCTLWVLGTVDDKIRLPAWPRVAVEAALAIALWATGFGWSLFASEVANLALTVLWIVGLVNAFNLIDNMDGAAATLAAVTAAAIGILALMEGDPALAALVFGLAGACLGFLPYNLSSPSRIFLGDGGSLPIGFVLAAALMALPGGEQGGWPRLLGAVVLAGLPLLDTALVMISRKRAGVPLLSGGRDHLTHRLRSRVGKVGNVALLLAALQGVLAAVAVGVIETGQGPVIAAWCVWFVIAAGTIALLETSSWAPLREPARQPGGPAALRSPRRAMGHASATEILLISFISVACGLSPVLYGFYNPTVWGPIALGLCAGLLGLLVARPVVLRPGALIATAALAAFWLWALASTGWAESTSQALTEANRWLLYAVLFAIVALLVRDDRLGRIVIAACTAAILGLALYVVTRMLTGAGGGLFLGGRLNGPLGYVNGQAGYFLLGVWPLLALAEASSSRLRASWGISGATLLLGLVLLGQTRAVIPALALSAIVLLIAVPGRTRRAWGLGLIAIALGVGLGRILAVYDSVEGNASPTNAVLTRAALEILLAAGAAGALWAAGDVISGFLTRRLAASRIRLQVVSVGTLVALLVAGGVALVNAVPDPAQQLRRQYQAFVDLRIRTDSSTRFTSAGSARYDYWRIAWRQLKDHPLHGVGAGNYDRTYFLERRTLEDVRQAHSIELQTLGELGLVGGGLLSLFVASVLLAFGRRARSARTDPTQRVIAVAAGGTFLVWLVHTSFDWLHLIPGLTGIALCSAAVLAGPWGRSGESGTRQLRMLGVAAAGVAVLVGAVLVGRAALAERYRDQGQQALARYPRVALEKADSSLKLNDSTVETYFLKSAAWAKLDRYPEARAALVGAATREPHNFVPWALLGDLASRRGFGTDASAYYRRASELNPRDPRLAQLARDPPSGDELQ